MPVSGELLRAINDEMQRIPIDDARWSELAVELNQLRAAAESVLAVHDFDQDPDGISDPAAFPERMNSLELG